MPNQQFRNCADLIQEASVDKVNTFKSVLVANRGEIALRVMRTAKAMGLRTIAVYSEQDADAPHVRFADDSYCLGPAPVADSYLRIDRILDAAAATKAEAVHPGYGFLSENATFAQACTDHNLVFVGPSANSVSAMGDKAEAKRRMIEADVPCIPGYQGTDQSDTALLAAASDVGYPLMVKAAAGGGGKGMRLVREGDDLAAAIQRARAEAESSFGSGDLILERAIERPRHVEIQVFADTHSNAIYFGERDCSVQRRHQKVLEEAPCPVMTDELRTRMGRAAVDAARAIDYHGAGTVEFLLDEDLNFYFLEMNTRLQVEHPVTEMVTGFDLVRLQFEVAQGRKLGITQDDISLNGHAIEARLYAEDPHNDFMPSTGKICLWKAPEGAGIRVDAGIETGGEVSPYYDPMLAKIIAHGESRTEAIQKLANALEQTVLFGPTSNRTFLIDCLNQETFMSGEASTAFVGDHLSEIQSNAARSSSLDVSVGAVLQFMLARGFGFGKSLVVYQEQLNWTNAAPLWVPFLYRLDEDSDPIEVRVSPLGKAAYAVSIDEETHEIEVYEAGDTHCVFVINGRRLATNYCEEAAGILHYSFGGRDLKLTNLYAFPTRSGEAAAAGEVLTPLRGLLVEVLVEVGQSVSKGDRLGTLEAMKMQHEIVAPVAGTVQKICFEAGQQVPANALFVEIEEES